MVGWGWPEHELVRNEESLDDGTISLFLADDSSSLCFSWQDMRMDETSSTYKMELWSLWDHYL